WACLRISAHRLAEIQELLVHRTQRCLRSGVLFFDVSRRCPQVSIGIVVLAAFPGCALRKPPSAVRSQLVLRLEPLAARLLILRAFPSDERHPLFERTACFFLQFSDPLLHHRDAWVYSIGRRSFCCCGSWHQSPPVIDPRGYAVDGLFCPEIANALQ